MVGADARRTLPGKTVGMTTIDAWELAEFTERFVADLAAAAHAATVVIGDRLGL